jgi:hypothetical protein
MNKISVNISSKMLTRGLKYGVGVIAGVGTLSIVINTVERKDLPYPLSHFDIHYLRPDRRLLRHLGYDSYIASDGTLEFYNEKAEAEHRRLKQKYEQKLKFGHSSRYVCNRAVQFDFSLLQNINPQFFNEELVESGLQSIYIDYHVYDRMGDRRSVMGPVPKFVVRYYVQQYYKKYPQLSPSTKEKVERLIEDAPNPERVTDMPSMTDYLMRNALDHRWWK